MKLLFESSAISFVIIGCDLSELRGYLGLLATVVIPNKVNVAKFAPTSEKCKYKAMPVFG